MVKGVNKQIIEIKSPNSPYFDRAVLYLKKGRQGESCYSALPTQTELETAFQKLEFSVSQRKLKRAVAIMSVVTVLSVALTVAMAVFCDIF